MTTEKKHTAYAMHRQGKHFRWVEVGVAGTRNDGTGFDVFLDRLPVGGFNGYVHIRTNNTRPDAATAPSPPSGEEDI